MSVPIIAIMISIEICHYLYKYKLHGESNDVDYINYVEDDDDRYD